jgi:hypothetical protein
MLLRNRYGGNEKLLHPRGTHFHSRIVIQGGVKAVKGNKGKRKDGKRKRGRERKGYNANIHHWWHRLPQPTKMTGSRPGRELVAAADTGLGSPCLSREVLFVLAALPSRSPSETT